MTILLFSLLSFRSFAFPIAPSQFPLIKKHQVRVVANHHHYQQQQHQQHQHHHDNNPRMSTTCISLFGGWFGGDDKTTTTKSKKEGQVLLGEYTIRRVKDTQDMSVQYASLSNYIENWAKLFTTTAGDKGGRGEIKLTTPVRIEFPLKASQHQEPDVVVRFLFQNTKTGYQNKKEEEASKQRSSESSKGVEAKENKATLQGGVEIIVEQRNENELYVSAKRCNVEEETIIKEMSEETILKELKEAIQVWKRETMK